MADESIIANLKSEGIKELITDLSGASKGFSLLDKSIAEAQKKLTTLDQSSQEFKDLTKEINAASTAMEAFNQDTGTLKKELRDTTNEIGNLERSLKELEKTGQKNTQVYKDLSAKQDELKKKAGQLKDTVSDLNAEIKNSGSDTKNLDKALRAINTVAAGYQAAQGALVLFGGENKKFEQTLLKLNAVMAITQGLQQIQNELSKKDSLFTLAAAKAKSVYAAATEGATLAMAAFRLAMVALGIGAFIAAIGYLISNWDKLKVSILGVTQTTEDYIKSKEKSLALSQKALALLDKELEYQIAIGAITEERAKQIKTEALAKRLQEEVKVLEQQKKLYTDLKKKREEQGVTSGFFITALVKSAFKISQAEIDSQKNSLLGQTQIVKDLTVELINSQKGKNKKIKEDTVKSAKDTNKDLSKLSEENLQRLIKALNEENRLQNKFRLERQQREMLSAENERKLAEERIRIANDSNKVLADKRLKDNKELQDSLAEQNRQRQEKDLLREQKHTEKVAFILQQIAQIADEIGNITSQAISIRATRELDELEKKKEQGLISEKKYEKESAKIKEEAAKKQRAADIAIAIAKIPLIFLQALTSAPPPFGLILASIASGIALAQVAILAASPLPKFKKGGQVSKKLGLIKGKSHSQGGVPIEVEGEEYVMPVEETRKNIKALKAIHEGKFDKLFVPRENLIQPDIFANIPNPANIDSSILIDKEDYSSINSRLDKVASELYWLTNETKKGNKSRERGTEKVVKTLQNKSKRYV